MNCDSALRIAIAASPSEGADWPVRYLRHARNSLSAASRVSSTIWYEKWAPKTTTRPQK